MHRSVGREDSCGRQVDLENNLSSDSSVNRLLELLDQPESMKHGGVCFQDFGSHHCHAFVPDRVAPNPTAGSPEPAVWGSVSSAEVSAVSVNPGNACRPG